MCGNRDRILAQLKQLQEQENIRILLAVESGSRAWGFASEDSDYDVRFVYVRSKEEYLRLDRRRDVIELPINDDLDISGWDLDKTLRLLHKSNPTVFEWFSSPVIYLEDSGFCRRFRPLLEKYFSSKRGLYHYLSMAESNCRDHLRGGTVKLKKYFYVLRPLLACCWIIEAGTPPPMLFSELADAMLDEALKPDVDRLLMLKQQSNDIREIPRIDRLDQYLDEGIAKVKEHLSGLSRDLVPDWSDLNQVFLEALF